MFPANGYIKIKVPNEILIDPTIGNTNCKVNSVPLDSLACSLSGKTITITHVNVNWAVASANAFFYIYSVLTKPSFNSTVLFDIELFDTDGVRILQSNTAYFIIAPDTITATCKVIMN